MGNAVHARSESKAAIKALQVLRTHGDDKQGCGLGPDLYNQHLYSGFVSESTNGRLRVLEKFILYSFKRCWKTERYQHQNYLFRGSFQAPISWKVYQSPMDPHIYYLEWILCCLCTNEWKQNELTLRVSTTLFEYLNDIADVLWNTSVGRCSRRVLSPLESKYFITKVIFTPVITSYTSAGLCVLRTALVLRRTKARFKFSSMVFLKKIHTYIPSCKGSD